MRIGYPCINRSLSCSANKTFRLASLKEERFLATVNENLACLQKMLEYNLERGLLFLRIGSGLVPFASHPAMKIDWPSYFQADFAALGRYIRKQGFRISMHPGQYTLLNALRPEVVANAVQDLVYHTTVLDLLNLGKECKVQIHVGGGYGDKGTSRERFVQNYRKLAPEIRQRLVIENDERIFSLRDCLAVHEEVGLPVLFDVLHHECNNNGEDLRRALQLAAATWGESDGSLMVDYSSQLPGGKRGSHAHAIDLVHFRKFLKAASGIECDVMCEIKDKEKSALLALAELKN